MQGIYRFFGHESRAIGAESVSWLLYLTIRTGIYRDIIREIYSLIRVGICILHRIPVLTWECCKTKSRWHRAIISASSTAQVRKQPGGGSSNEAETARPQVHGDTA
jgi:hypothetical protein